MTDAPKGLRLIVAGGGTGGHLFPGIAIGEAFLETVPGSRVLFVGSPRGIEARVLPERNLPHEFLEVRALKGLSLGKKLATLLGLPLALLRAMGIVRKFGADVVIGVGGYVSGPVVLAARLLGRKTAIQEQNSVPGFTNRVLGKIVHRVFTAFESAAVFFPARKVRLAGNPIRKEIASAGALPLPEKKTITVLGGSQGARRLNEVVPETCKLLRAKRPDLGWIHQTGEQGFAAAKERYAGATVDVAPFYKDMLDVFRKTSLVVGRSGASTLAELCAVGRPAVFIPFPFATDNHQEINARELERAGAAEVILEKDLTAKELADRIEKLLASSETLPEMARRAAARGRPKAAREIAAECAALAAAGR
ncbi:MAG: undecaprenyldiphospho-muramoylpentapeptide beta-N-acetylglucosaminyltransferase [Bdellovibrionota bacterium]